MKLLLPIIALLLVGCKKSPEEMVVGEWKRAIAESNWAFKFRADGVVEIDEGMGEWGISGEEVSTTFEWNDGTIKHFFNIEGPSKLVLFRIVFDDGQNEDESGRDPPLSFYRVVE